MTFVQRLDKREDKGLRLKRRLGKYHQEVIWSLNIKTPFRLLYRIKKTTGDTPVLHTAKKMGDVWELGLMEL